MNLFFFNQYWFFFNIALIYYLSRSLNFWSSSPRSVPWPTGLRVSMMTFSFSSARHFLSSSIYLGAVMWHSSSHLHVNNSAHERFCLCRWLLIWNRWVKKLITLHPPTTACLGMLPAAIQTCNKNTKQKPTPWGGLGPAGTSEPTLERLTISH